jgi:hypothetical protein
MPSTIPFAAKFSFVKDVKGAQHQRARRHAARAAQQLAASPET